MTKPTTAISSASPDDVVRAFGDEVIFHLGGAETDGRLTVFTNVTPPGGGPPPHSHDNEDEWFFPLEGSVEFLLDGEWREAPVGSVVFAARRSVHAFRNTGAGPLKMLIHCSPAGFEVFFRRCAEEFSKAGPPDMERIVQIGIEHGIHFPGG